MEITYENLIAKHKLQDIAIKLEYIKADDAPEKKSAAASRICNWKRTGIPLRVLAKKEKELAELCNN